MSGTWMRCSSGSKGNATTSREQWTRTADVLDFLVTRHRDARAAKRFFRKLLQGQAGSPWQLVTDQLGSYTAARRDLGLTAAHRTARYENNRAEVSHYHSRGGYATCAASSRPGSRSDFWRSTRPSTTHSGSRVIASRHDTIDCTVSRPSALGTWRRALAREQYTHRLSDQNRFCPRQLDNATPDSLTGRRDSCSRHQCRPTR